MARMSKQAMAEKAQRDYNGAMKALTDARDALIAQYEILQSLNAAGEILDPLSEAINTMHDKIADLEDTQRYRAPLRCDPELLGSIYDPMHW